jgi:hypothetical protein
MNIIVWPIPGGPIGRARDERLRRPWAVVTLCASALSLGACDQTPTAPRAPMVGQPVTGEPGVTAGSAVDPSVPSAASVFSPASAALADPPTGRSNSAMSATQESTAMPMPGQNNDHSAPLGPARRASQP